MEKESFSRLETISCEMEELKDLVILMLEDCFALKVTALKEYEVREKYMTAQTLTNSIFRLLNYSIKDMDSFIKKVYEERKAQKEGVTNANNN